MKAKTFIDQVEVIVRSGKGGDGADLTHRPVPVAAGIRARETAAVHRKR